jgi:hypothetical protein
MEIGMANDCRDLGQLAAGDLSFRSLSSIGGKPSTKKGR